MRKKYKNLDFLVNLATEQNIVMEPITCNDAKKINRDITIQDIREWKEDLDKKKNTRKGLFGNKKIR